MEPIRVTIAEPLDVVVAGIRSWLGSGSGFTLTGHTRSGPELLELLEHQPCDLVLMEVSLPGMDGIDTMRAVRQAFPGQRVLAFSALTEIEFVNSMLVEGAMGYLTKNATRDEFLHAMREVFIGTCYISPAAKQNVERGYVYTSKDPNGEYVGLTTREREIIRMIAEELTNEEMAQALFISSDTVKSHRKQLMAKLNVRNGAGLVRYAIGRRWV